MNGRARHRFPHRARPAIRPRARWQISLLFCALAALVGSATLTGSALAAPPAQFGAGGSGAGEFFEGNGAAVNQESGDVYFSDRNNNRVEQWSAEGQFIRAWGWGVADGSTPALQSCEAVCFAGLEGSGAGQFGFPEGVAVDNDPTSTSHGDIYVLDTRNSRIEKFGPEGEFKLAFGEAGTGPGQFERLNGLSLAVGPDGSVYVGDENRVQRFSPTGTPEAQIPIPGAGFVENLAVDPVGNLYVQASGLLGVHKYSPGGTELGTPRDQAGNPSAITIGPGDQLFVNDGNIVGTHHLLAYDEAGTQLASFDSGLEGGARGIAYGQTIGSIYVINFAAVRIVPVPPPGPLILAGTEAAPAVGTTSATLAATLNPEGAATEYHFEYGLADCAGGGCQSTPTESLPADFEDHSLSAPLTGLSPRTVYHFRLVASNTHGEVKGPDQSFETLPPVSIDSVSVSAVSATGATLEATLNPHGELGHYRFEYDTLPYAEGDGPHGTVVPFPDGSLGSGNVDVLRTAVLEALVLATTYHYRVIAETALGVVESADRVFTTQGFAGALLPDARQWEMVSPPDKQGSPLQPLTKEGAAIQAAAGGGAFTYVAQGPIEPDPAGNRASLLGYNQAISRRTPSAWGTREITTSHEEVAIVLAGFPAEYPAFSEDLSTAVVEAQGKTPLSPSDGERTPYLRQEDGTFTPLVTAANVAPDIEFGCEEEGGGRCEPNSLTGVHFAGASPDLKHVVIKSPQGLTPGFAPPPESNSLYEWTDGSLLPVSVLPGGAPIGARLGNSAVASAAETNLRGAISADGSRVFFQASDGHLYLRDTGRGETLQLDAVQNGSGGGVAGSEFQGASSDGSKVFFTDDARLTAASQASPEHPDLYMCTVPLGAAPACELHDLTVPATPSEAADVQGTVSAFSADGRYVYFAANGILAPGAVHGDCFEESETALCNLYRRDTATEETTLVAILSGNDSPDWLGHRDRLGNLTARTSPDGRYLAFMSQRSPTGYENRDAKSGARDQEVYLFDGQAPSAESLRCVSCAPSGARPRGVHDLGTFPGLLIDRPGTWATDPTSGHWLAASIPGWTLNNIEQANYQSRYLDDSGRLFFNAVDALVPQDSNGVADVYQYEPPGVGSCSQSEPGFTPSSGGCLALISSGTSPQESTFLDASESGDDAFFLTASRLSSSDIDTAYDVYDAHVCSAGSPCFPTPPPPTPDCNGDTCQQPATPPAHPTPGSALLNGPGNVVQCPKGKVKKHGKCVKKAKKHKKKQKNKRTASQNRRGNK